MQTRVQPSSHSTRQSCRTALQPMKMKQSLLAPVLVGHASASSFWRLERVAAPSGGCGSMTCGPSARNPHEADDKDGHWTRTGCMDRLDAVSDGGCALRKNAGTEPPLGRRGSLPPGLACQTTSSGCAIFTGPGDTVSSPSGACVHSVYHASLIGSYARVRQSDLVHVASQCWQRLAGTTVGGGFPGGGTVTSSARVTSPVRHTTCKVLCCIDRRYSLHDQRLPSKSAQSC